MTATEHGTVTVNGGELPYEVQGQGYPLVLIHAGVANMRMWDAQVAAFAPYFRVIRYDTRGFGRSRTASVAFSNRQDLAALLDHLGVQRAHVLGLSRGGSIATDFTLEYPERVSALVAVAAGFSGFDGPVENTAEELALDQRSAELEEQGAFDELAEVELQMWVDGFGRSNGPVDPQVRALVGELNSGNFQRDDGTPTPQPLEPPAATRLHTISVPTLVLWGDCDITDMQVMGATMAREVPNAQHHVFPNVAHMVNLERPEEFNQRVLDFLRSVPTE